MKRVLLVSDRIIDGELGASFFDRHSISVRTAHHAAEALHMAPLYRPDLIVLRDDLPGTTVPAFLASLRATLPQAKFLLVTELLGDALSDADSCDACLVQPVEAEQLLETIAMLLEIRVRRGPRVPLDALVHLEGFGMSTADASCVANAIDVSEFGILLESSEHLAFNTAGTVLFFLPVADGRIAARGTVRVAMDEVRLHYAIEFTEIDPSVREPIARYIDDQRNA